MLPPGRVSTDPLPESLVCEPEPEVLQSVMTEPAPSQAAGNAAMSRAAGAGVAGADLSYAVVRSVDMSGVQLNAATTTGAHFA